MVGFFSGVTLSQCTAKGQDTSKSLARKEPLLYRPQPGFSVLGDPEGNRYSPDTQPDRIKSENADLKPTMILKLELSVRVAHDWVTWCLEVAATESSSN
jgi:hypothetical protein